MGTDLYTDNWLLQEVAECLQDGLIDDTAGVAVVDKAAGTHTWGEVPRAAIQVQAVLALLVDVVTRDTLVVPSEQQGAWAGSHALEGLAEAGVLAGRSFETRHPRWRPAFEAALQGLCVTPSLRHEHDVNYAAFLERRPQPNRFASQVITGTAGLLRRASIAQLPYAAHPVRQRLMEQGRFGATPDAEKLVANEIAGARARVFSWRDNAFAAHQTQLLLPPVAAQIIDAATSVDDLFPIALQMRGEYVAYRRWVGELQDALEAGEPVVRWRQVLREVAASTGGSAGDTRLGQVAVGLQLGVFAVELPVNFARDGVELVLERMVSPGGTADELIRRVFPDFGVKTTLRRMVLTPGANQILAKLMRLFGEPETELGLTALAELQRNRLV